jgi:hypothetical protein
LTELADQALLEASRIKTLIAGKPSDAAIPIEVGTLSDVECLLRELVATVRHGQFKRRQKKAKKRPLTSRSKLNKRPDTAYLAFVRARPCCHCGDTDRVEAHHTGKRGMGQKAPDSTTVPLCHACHMCFHTDGALDGLTRAQTMDTFAVSVDLIQAEWAKRQDKEAF